MKNEDRRREFGKALIDIGKYSITVGIIGSMVTEKVTPSIVFICIVVTIIAFVIGFYTIPPKREDK